SSSPGRWIRPWWGARRRASRTGCATSSRGARSPARIPVGGTAGLSVESAHAARNLCVMSREWHQFRNPGLEIGRPPARSVARETLGLDHWRTLPRAQTPPWPDETTVAEVCHVLDTVPSIVAPYEVDHLRAKLAQVCEGQAFLLQGGDCAETFVDNTESHLLATVRTLLQMA